MANQVDIGKQGDAGRLKLLGKRLQLAILLRDKDNTEFIGLLRAKKITSKASFYYHCDGAVRPSDRVVEEYERLLDLPHGWLWRQDETAEELDEALDAYSKGEDDNPILMRVEQALPAKPRENNVIDLPINHPPKHSVPESSITLEIRHIPILPEEKISAWLAGERSFEMLSAKTLPIPDLPNLGPRAWAHRLGMTDYSMTGLGDRSYPPGTLLVIDPDHQIMPGDRIVIRPRGEPHWLLRKYQAPWPLPTNLAKAKEFTLVATNQSFEPIRVTKPREWELGGRVMFSLQPE